MSSDIDPSEMKQLSARRQAGRALSDRRQAELEKMQHMGLDLPPASEGTNRHERRAYRARFIRARKQQLKTGE